MKETRLIRGHRQYEITEDGIITRIINAHKFKKPGPIKSSIQKISGKDTGYWYVSLLTRDDKTYSGEIYDERGVYRISVHRLVCQTWHGAMPIDKPWVNHKDGNKSNNHYSNLEWTSISENIQHKFDTGLQVMPKGKDHWMFGTKSKESTKKLQSISKIGERHPKFKGWYVKDGKEYASTYIAAKETGLDPKQVYVWTKSNRNGWSFKPKEAPKEAVSTFVP